MSKEGISFQSDNNKNPNQFQQTNTKCHTASENENLGFNGDLFIKLGEHPKKGNGRFLQNISLISTSLIVQAY